jgi:zona occludens toxin (predicted ATPase)
MPPRATSQEQQGKQDCEVFMKSQTLIFLVVSAVVFAGCRYRSNSVSGPPVLASADASPNDAIGAAIQAHLTHNGNLSLQSFETELKQVNLDGDHAQAQVEFHVKSGPGSMRLTYALAKRDGTWLVVGSTPGGSNFSHPALDKTQAPAADETVVGNSAIFRALDNFHGSAATRPQDLPPGHPPVVASPKDKQRQVP